MSGLRGSFGDPLPQSPMPPPDAALYPTAPLSSGRVHLHLGLEVLGVVEAGGVWATGLYALRDALGVLEGLCHCHQEVLPWKRRQEG